MFYIFMFGYFYYFDQIQENDFKNYNCVYYYFKNRF